MTETEERMHAVALIDEAVAHGARQEPACAILGISLNSLLNYCRNHHFLMS